MSAQSRQGRGSTMYRRSKSKFKLKYSQQQEVYIKIYLRFCKKLHLSARKLVIHSKISIILQNFKENIALKF